jgi:DNA-binding transcriptional MerR regulator
MSKTYNITELEKISGIKSHTIRIWEKRYNLLTPKRTPTNIRYYDEQDLKKLLMVVILYKNGMKISEIANLPIHRLQELVLSFKMPEAAQTPIVEQLLLAITDFNQSFLNDILIKEIINHGIEAAFERVIFPFLQKVGLLWLTDVTSCLHLNFAHSQVSRFLWQNLKFQNIYSKHCYLAFAPQNSLTIPLLIYFSFILNRFNKPTTFLGQIYNIADVINMDKFKDCTLMTVYKRFNKDFYEPLKQTHHKVLLIDLDNQSEDFENENITVIRSFDEFKRIIKEN